MFDFIKENTTSDRSDSYFNNYKYIYYVLNYYVLNILCVYRSQVTVTLSPPYSCSLMVGKLTSRCPLCSLRRMGSIRIKFVSISVGPEGTLYALDDEGELWMRKEIPMGDAEHKMFRWGKINYPKVMHEDEEVPRY